MSAITKKRMPFRLKRSIAAGGALLAATGLMAATGLCCVVGVAIAEGQSGLVPVSLAGFTFLALTAGAGGVTFWHALRSLDGKPSTPLRLPPAWQLAGLFGFLVATGMLILGANFAPGVFFPPILLMAATLPPLWAIAWFIQAGSGAAPAAPSDALSWRRGLTAFAGGATLSVGLALLLEITLPAIVLALVSGLASTVLESVEALLDALAGQEIASASASPGFIFIFAHVAIIAPLAEELAKPLVTLPLLGRLSPRQAFLAAAMAGAGFAALENVIYAGAGLPFWSGILVVRALGGAIHPLGAGLVGLGWRAVMRAEAGGWGKWLAYFGLAAGMHALWNGGSLLVITLAGAGAFGSLPPEIDVLGLSAAGTTLALLVVLGLAALWLGRSIARRPVLSIPPSTFTPLAGVESAGQDGAEDKRSSPVVGDQTSDLEFVLSDRAAALWALACLAAIVPAGITGLQLLLGK